MATTRQALSANSSTMISRGCTSSPPTPSIRLHFAFYTPPNLSTPTYSLAHPVTLHWQPEPRSLKPYTPKPQHGTTTVSSIYTRTSAFNAHDRTTQDHTTVSSMDLRSLPSGTTVLYMTPKSSPVFSIKFCQRLSERHGEPPIKTIPKDCWRSHGA
jgi:hypothetical protein